MDNWQSTDEYLNKRTRQLNDKELLHHAYVENENSIEEICEFYHVDTFTVRDLLEEYDIPIRDEDKDVPPDYNDFKEGFPSLYDE